MNMHFFNNAKKKKGLNRVKMKRVKLPEDDRENIGKGLSLQKRHWGQKQTSGC